MATKFAKLSLEYRVTGASGIGAACASIDAAGWPDDLLVTCTPTSLTIVGGRIVPSGPSIELVEVSGTVHVLRRRSWLLPASEPVIAWSDDAAVLSQLLAWIRPA